MLAHSGLPSSTRVGDREQATWRNKRSKHVKWKNIGEQVAELALRHLII
jgi:hypothetical protein